LEWKNEQLMDGKNDDETGDWGEMFAEKRWIRKRQIKTWLS